MLDVYSGVVNMFWTHSPIYSERISFVGLFLDPLHLIVGIFLVISLCACMSLFFQI